MPRRTVRLRLALFFGVLFFLTGAALLTVTYGLMRYSLTHLDPVAQTHTGHHVAGDDPVGAPPVGPQEWSASGTERALENQKLEVLRQLWIVSAIALAIMSVGSVALGWLVAGRVLRPLRTITATARRISATSLHQRLALAGPDDELKELGDTFDALLARLDVAFEAQRRFVANASHELRTPIARQRALGQLALSDPAATEDSLRLAHERILAAGAQQERLIDALLTLARGQAGIDVREPVDLAGLTDEIVIARQSEAAHRQITVHRTIGPSVVPGHRGLAERLVTNLIDNALRHNHPGGQINVNVDHPVLVVSNTGPPVPTADLDRLYQPFQRLASARTGPGLGLGLSIVEAIARAHDATLTTTANPDGGLTVTVGFHHSFR